MTSIVIFTSEFPPGPGGIGNHAYNLSRQFAKNHFPVTVITPSRKDHPYKAFDQLQPFRIFRYSENGTYIWRLFTIFTILLKEVPLRKDTIVICSGLMPLILGGIMPLVKRMVVLHGHEVLMGGFLFQQSVKAMLKKYDQIIAVSSFAKEKALEKFPELKIKIINNGADLKRFGQFLNSKDSEIKEVRLVTLGSLSPRKGQHNVIKALPHLKEYFNDISYHMIGTPYIKEELLDLAISLNVEDKVIFHGILCDKDVIDVFNKSNIFVMLSENQQNGDVEGFGIAIIEANYLGLPAIGSKGCGIEDAILEGKTGRVIECNNAMEFKEAIMDILNNYDKFSNAAKNWAKQHDWDIVSAQYLETINELC